MAERTDPASVQGGPGTNAEPLSRRRFLSLAAASAALAATAACEKPPADTIVPYTRKPKDVIPGVADYYASTFQEGLVAYGVLVKAREGRPIHIEGNDEHPLFGGKTSLRAQAQTIGLYDPERLRHPRMGGKPAARERAGARVVAALKEAAAGGKPVLLLTPAVVSPTRRAVIEGLAAALPGLEHVEWEPALGLADLAAAEALYGDGRLPRYRLERARVVATLEADFLGTMGNAVQAAAEFASGRRPAGPDEPMSRLYAFESRLSLTGSKADARVPLRPSGAAPLAFAVAGALHGGYGVPLPPGFEAGLLAPFGLEAVARRFGADPAVLAALVDDLAAAGKASLVIAGPSLPVEAHAAVALVSAMLGAEGYTIDAARSAAAPPLATPAEMAELSRRLGSGAYGAAILWETNPSYALPDSDAFNHALARLPLSVYLGVRENETARRVDVVLPASHWLESWNDYEAATDLLSLQQPLIRPLYDTPQAEEILLGWTKALSPAAPAEADYRSYLMARWRREVYPAGTLASFEQYWTAAVHDGVLRRPSEPGPPRRLKVETVADAARRTAAPGAARGLELLIEPDLRMWDGRYAEIGWLQELPDPITKVCWGNWLAVSPADAKAHGLSDGDMVAIEAGGCSATLPALVQPGQAEGAVFAVLGYGREGSVAGGRGASLFPLVAADGSAPFFRLGARIARSGGNEPLVRSQTEFSLHGRDLARVWSLEQYARSAAPPADEKELATLNANPKWPDHRWGMAIDLAACLGCGACQIACQSENNIPVVGPERVARGRIMHWIRTDLYYDGPPDNPEVARVPMPCQQCEDAPCEPVCPVAATVHSEDGLNEQIYNRCIGVRYCAANCPYMGRRFNFFDYTSAITDPLDLAFNPDVTVRPRGVMEKCTFCVQRIRNGVQIARDEGRPVRDGEIVTACAAACPADAIVFGDLKDPNSRVSRLSRSDRGYKLLAELGTRPAVTYLADLRNPPREPRERSNG